LQKEEETARDYFKTKGFDDIAFEPKGNRPPDLLLDNEIAVEVRRLNQFKGNKPLEELRSKIEPRLLTLFNEYKNGQHSMSAWVSFYYSRPLKVDKGLIKQIKNTLDDHVKDMTAEKEYLFGDRLRIKIGPSKKTYDRPFVYRISVDNDHGGLVIQNIYESLKLIIPEKKNKIKPYRAEYKIWWLALIDTIGYGLDNNDIKQLRQVIDFEIPFDKVFLISATNHEYGIEL
jgi:hypothetical protein